MNRLLFCICLVTAGFATSLEVKSLPNLGLAKLHTFCDVDAHTLCRDVRNDIVQVESTPFHNLKRLTDGHETYPFLNYGPPTDMCMWHAFFNNKIQREECYASMKSRISDVQKKLSFVGNEDVVLIDLPIISNEDGVHLYFVHHPSSIWPNILAFLSYSALLSYLAISTCDLEQVSFAVASASLFVSALVLSFSSPFITLGASIVLLIGIFFVSTDEEDEQPCQDDYRRMGDDETIYVAVPLQVV